jgi:hypothetical protein
MNQSTLTDKELRFLKRFITDSQSKWNQYYPIFAEVVILILMICAVFIYPLEKDLSVSITNIEYQTDLTPAEWVPKAFHEFARLTDSSIQDHITNNIFWIVMMSYVVWFGISWRARIRNRIIAKLLCAHWELVKPGANFLDDKNQGEVG